MEGKVATLEFVHSVVKLLSAGNTVDFKIWNYLAKLVTGYISESYVCLFVDIAYLSFYHMEAKRLV